MKKILYLSLLAVLMAAGILFSVSCSGPTYNTTTTPAAISPLTTAPGTNAAVTIQNFAFSPASITVSPGTTVTWTNKDSATHTVTSTAGGNVLNSPNLAQGATFSYTFAQTGTFEYKCGIHPSMLGKVIVQ